MKKSVAIKIISLAAAIFAAICPYTVENVYASDAAETSAEQKLEDSVKEQLDSLDTSGFDEFINSLDGESYKIFGSQSFKEKMEKVLKGDLSTDYGSLFSLITSLFFSETLKILPVIASICAIAILCNLLSTIKPQKAKTGEIVHFVCYLSIVLIVLKLIYQVVENLALTLNVISNIMSLVFPVLLTLMTASGSTASSSIYQPAVALLCTSITSVFTGIIVPLFIASIILNVVSNLTDNIRVSKFAAFFKSAGQWVTGIVFTVFLAFLSIQGISASAYDSVSVRAVKYAINNSVPIVGGYIKEGFDLILGSTVLIKNAAGITGLLLLLAYILAPVLNMVVLSLGLKLSAAVSEPVSNEKIPSFLYSAAKSFSLLIAAFLSVAFMFFITVMLLLMTSNSVLV